MLDRNETYEKLTAVVDHEIADKKELADLEYLINNDDDFKYEYLVQNSVKNLLKNKSHKISTPSIVLENVEKSIFGQTYQTDNKINWLDRITDFLFTPKYAFGAALILVLLIIFNLSSNLNSDEIFISQSGNNNAILQARDNYHKILAGELGVQFASDNPEAVSNYFQKSGVNYATIVPSFPKWNLLGGVVSDHDGIKLAHQAYASADGEVLYLYQIDQKYFKDKTVCVSDDMNKYLESNLFAKHRFEDEEMYCWKMNGKLFLLVTNEDPALIEDEFISKFM
ncbi:MAG: hypothetical protein K9J12_00465 [Melioribacteraceae bacterium]|nr:hypothetical protein [Melioribacteraceae bacterium]MCF8265442.1 hypothetical protein [Melioribacteraceae bacterium]MCF8413666.1 hypothetical protein [Melioribacteraceae bacterium]MCF8431904.1 hypothetical protein [Melioribacteraceae bacterium]